jgi:hypothetical protein
MLKNNTKPLYRIHVSTEPTRRNKDLYPILACCVSSTNSSDASILRLSLIPWIEDLEAFQDIIALDKHRHSTHAEHAAPAISQQLVSLRRFSHSHLERRRCKCRGEMRKYGRSCRSNTTNITSSAPSSPQASHVEFWAPSRLAIPEPTIDGRRPQFLRQDASYSRSTPPRCQTS